MGRLVSMADAVCGPYAPAYTPPEVLSSVPPDSAQAWTNCTTCTWTK